MTLRKFTIGLGWVSAFGISYFAVDTLVSLGDWGRVWTTDPKLLIEAFIVAIPPACAAWLGIVLVEQAANTRRIITVFLLTVVGAWVWLYLGTLMLAIIRLQ